jgi:uncharacterized protein (DUF1800 family)
MNDVAIARNRFGLGARPGETAPGDARRWLTDQFARYQPAPPALATVPDRDALAEEVIAYMETARAARQERLKAGAATPAAPAQPRQTSPRMIERRQSRRDVQDIYQLSVAARVNAALTTETPFVERLVHFWSNHFAISAEKVQVVAFAGNFEFEVIRPHVLGKFGDMLTAVEHHPAMLIYLDQPQSMGPNSLASTRAARAQRKRGLNENLAREIMELHTLGVRTGYSQADVTEFARALTGWTVGAIGPGRSRRMGGEPGVFQFQDKFHEPGPRKILGKTFPAADHRQGEAVLAMLATHPATAKHIATKLARHFAGDEPPASLVAKLERAFMDSGGDLPTVYRALIDAPEAWTADPVKFKTPWEWSVSAARAMGADAFPTGSAAGLVRQLGQHIWRPGSPAGFDDVAASWAGPDAVMRRVEAAARFAARAQGEQDARVLAANLFGDGLSEATGQAIARAESPAQGIALLLVSPEFMRR